MKKGLAQGQNSPTSPDHRHLRHRAEARLQGPLGSQGAGVEEQPSMADPRRLLHELQVHQVELELQNAELTEARHKLEALLEKYTDLYDFAPVVYLTLDREGIICGATLACASLLGIERSRLLQRRFGVFVGATDRPAFNACLKRAFESREEQLCEVALERADHQPWFVQIRAKASADGKECRAVVVGINERKRAEAELGASERLATALVNAITEPLLLMDREGTILTVNPAMAQRLREALVELVGENFYSLHPAELAQRQRTWAQEVIRSGRPLRFEDAANDAVLDNHIFPVKDAAGRVSALVWFSVDITASKRAEETQREQLTQIDAIYHTAPLGLCLLDAQLRIVRANEALAAMSGVPVAELLGRTMREMLPLLANAAEAALRQITATGRPLLDVEVTGQNLAQTGGIRTWATQWSPVNLPRVGGVGLNVIVQDITQQKSAEQRLREAHDSLELCVRERTLELQTANTALRTSEQRFRNLFESAPIGIALHDARGHYLLVNQAYQHMTGYSEAELLARGVKGVTHPDDLAEGRRLFGELQAGSRTQYQRQKRYVRRDGELVWAVSTTSAVRDDHGGLLWLISVVEDITQRRSVEQALRRTQEEYRELVENANSIILRWNRDGLITFLNEFGLKCFGFDQPSIAGRHLVGTLVPETESNGRDMRWLISQISAQPEAFARSVSEALCQDGRRLWVAWCNQAIRDERGKVVEILSVGTDITERRQLHKELVETAERERQRLGRDLHDSLGGQLTGASILSTVLFLKLTAAANPDAAVAEKVVNTINEVIAQTRSLAQNLCPVALDASGLVNGLREFAAAAAQRFQIACQFHASRNLEVSDFLVATHLFRIVEEAVTNAVRHGKARHISISLLKLKGHLALEIRDDGSGLPASMSANQGMGLRTMRYRADLMSAQLTVENRRAGGTRVACRLPVPPFSGNPVSTPP